MSLCVSQQGLQYRCPPDRSSEASKGNGERHDRQTGPAPMRTTCRRRGPWRRLRLASCIPHTCAKARRSLAPAAAPAHSRMRPRIRLQKRCCPWPRPRPQSNGASTRRRDRQTSQQHKSAPMFFNVCRCKICGVPSRTDWLHMGYAGHLLSTIDFFNVCRCQICGVAQLSSMSTIQSFSG